MRLIASDSRDDTSECKQKSRCQNDGFDTPLLVLPKVGELLTRFFFFIF